MGLPGWLRTIGGIGSVIAAPFTGGTSLAALPAILGGVAAVGGALEGRKGARTSTSTSTINEPPAYAGLGDLLRKRITDRLNSTYDMSGYTANGIKDINNAYGGVDQSINNSLTSRGLGTSPIAGAADIHSGLARAGNIAQFLNTVPMLQR